MKYLKTFHMSDNILEHVLYPMKTLLAKSTINIFMLLYLLPGKTSGSEGLLRNSTDLLVKLVLKWNINL